MTLFAKIYLDEDVDILVANLLSARGLEAKTAREQEMLGRLDPEQLAFAVFERSCLLTHNRLDFEKLHNTYLSIDQPHAGILIAKRRNPYEIAERVAILLDTLTADEIANQLFYV